MLLKFENGIKLLFLFFLTNVASKSNADWQDTFSRYLSQKQDQIDQDPSERIRSNWDQLERRGNQDQAEGNQGNTDQSERSQSRSVSKRDDIVFQLDSEKRTDGSSFLSRLLSSRQGPVVVFLTPGTDTDIDSDKTDEKASDFALPEVRAREEDVELPKYVPAPGENDAYVLYNVLRTTQEDEDLDPEANAVFERTKDILRTAFALRCGARQSCERKCPEKKPSCPLNCQKVKKEIKNECQRKCPTNQPKTCERKCERVVEKKVDECEQKVDECEAKQEQKCEMKCQKVFDELDACPKPKKEGPKCGKTMPPRWLLRALQKLEE